MFSFRNILVLVFFYLILFEVQSECVQISPGVLDGSPANPHYPTKPWTTPIILPPEAGQLLENTCDLYKFDSPVCCNTSQVQVMALNFNRLMNHIFYRCPACLMTMKRYICDQTCSINQSDFIQINGMREDSGWNGFVNNVTFHLTPKFRADLWQSCKDNPLGARPVRESYPNVEQFLLFTYSQPTKPKIIPIFLQAGEPGYVGNSIPCQEMCSCSTCTEQCQHIDALKPDYGCKIFGLSCVVFSSIAGGAIFGLSLMAVLYVLITQFFGWINERFIKKSFLFHQDENFPDEFESAVGDNNVSSSKEYQKLVDDHNQKQKQIKISSNPNMHSVDETIPFYLDSKDAEELPRSLGRNYETLQ